MVATVDEITDIVRAWEKKYYNSSGNLRKEFCNVSDKPLQVLSDRLTKVSREYSIDTHRDSPFALLAKENDLLWKLGGKPDDTVVVVARIDAPSP